MDVGIKLDTRAAIRALGNAGDLKIGIVGKGTECMFEIKLGDGAGPRPRAVVDGLGVAAVVADQTVLAGIETQVRAAAFAGEAMILLCHRRTPSSAQGAVAPSAPGLSILRTDKGKAGLHWAQMTGWRRVMTAFGQLDARGIGVGA